MALAFIFANNASSTLASDVAPADTVIYLAAGTGARFPDPVMYSEQFVITVKNPATNESEIMYCTERNIDALNVVRAQEGTVALSFVASNTVAHQLTAAQLEYLRDL